MRTKHWLARLVIAAWSGHFVPIAILAPESLMARSLVGSGILGPLVLMVLAGLVSVALLDNLVNDALPARFKFTGMNYRHVGFMGMAIALVLLGGIVAIRSGAPIVLLSFLLPAFFAVVITWLDIFARHRDLGAVA